MGPTEMALLAGGTAAAVPAAKNLLVRILGPSADLIGERLKDNLLSVLAKAETMSEEASLELQRMPARTGLAILQRASREEDDSMQTRWAALLANAARSDKKADLPPSFPEILAALSPGEARLLDAVYDKVLGFCKELGVPVKFSHGHLLRSDLDYFRRIYEEAGLTEAPWVDSLGEHQKLTEVEKEKQRNQAWWFSVGLENLIRLGLLSKESKAELVGDDTWDEPSSLAQRDYYLLSRLGIEFVTACRKPA